MNAETDIRGDSDSFGEIGLVPDVIPIFPLPETVLLPGELLPLHVFEPRYQALTRDALNKARVIGVVAIRPGHEGEAEGAPPLADVGCLGFIAQHRELPDGRYLLWLVGLEPFRIDRELAQEGLYRQAKVTYLPTAEAGDEVARVTPLRRELRSVLPDLVDGDERTHAAMKEQLQGVTDSQLVALACEVLDLGAERKQSVLETASLTQRYALVFEALYAHLERQDRAEPTDPSQLN